jgi:hypothetical protein
LGHENNENTRDEHVASFRGHKKLEKHPCTTMFARWLLGSHRTSYGGCEATDSALELIHLSEQDMLQLINDIDKLTGELVEDMLDGEYEDVIEDSGEDISSEAIRRL